jgi:hypothetical protein
VTIRWTRLQMAGFSCRHEKTNPLSRERSPVAVTPCCGRAARRELTGRSSGRGRFTANPLQRRAPLIEGSDGSGWPPAGVNVQARIAQLDDHRLELRSRLSTVFRPYAKDPLARFLRNSLRVPTDDFYSLMGTFAGHAKGAVSISRFDLAVAESNSLLAEYRRELEDEIRSARGRLDISLQLAEEAKGDVAEERSFDLAKLKATVTPTFRAWVEQRRESWPWKFVWPFVEKPLLNLVWVPATAVAVAAWHWLRSRL